MVYRNVLVIMLVIAAVTIMVAMGVTVVIPMIVSLAIYLIVTAKDALSSLTYISHKRECTKYILDYLERVIMEIL